MAAYTTVGDVREALAAAGATSGTAGSMADADIADAIEEATAEIDGKVDGAPFDPEVPTLVSSVAQDIAAYLATLKHRKQHTMADRHPVQLRYDRATSLLADMAAGRIDLTDETEDVGASTGAVSNPYTGDLFTLDDLSLGLADCGRRRWHG